MSDWVKKAPPGYLNFTIEDLVIRAYPHDIFEDLGTLPNENTLEVNITHEQLSALADGFNRRIALAPTRVEEGGTKYTKSPFGKGYDIKLDTAKEVVFQHKPPSRPEFSDRMLPLSNGSVTG